MARTNTNSGGGGGSPAGSDTQIQYNNAGSFGASSDFTFNPANSDFISIANGAKLLNAENIFFGAVPFTGSYAEYTDTNDYINLSGIFGQTNPSNSKGTIFGLIDNTNGNYSTLSTSSKKSTGEITTTLSAVDSNEYGTQLIIKTNTSDSSLFSKNTANSSQEFELGTDDLQMKNVNNLTGDTSQLQIGDGTLSAKLPQTQQSAVTFTGSGLDDLTVSGLFSGTVPTTYTVTVNSINLQTIPYNNLVGGTFTVGNTVSGSISGATGTILSDDGVGSMVVQLPPTPTEFIDGDVIDNGFGVTADASKPDGRYDTFDWTDGTNSGTDVSMSTSPISLSNGLDIVFSSITGHKVADSWTWTYSKVQNNILDFSNGTYKFGTDFGTDYFGYEVGKNILGFGLKGAVNKWVNGSDIGLNGIYYQGTNLQCASFIQSGSNSSSVNVVSTGVTAQSSDGTNTGSFNVDSNDFLLRNNIGGVYHGISQSAGVVTIGNLSGGNNTKITIDDVNEHITISNLPAYDDDTAAGVGGLTAGMVYMTTGSGSAPLNAAGILMIKQ